MLIDAAAMPVAGLVLTLAQDSRLADAVTHELRIDPRVTLGERTGQQLPVVVETKTIAEDELTFEELSRAPGVVFVELAFHDFSDVEDFGDAPRPRRRRRLPAL